MSSEVMTYDSVYWPCLDVLQCVDSFFSLHSVAETGFCSSKNQLPASNSKRLNTVALLTHYSVVCVMSKVNNESGNQPNNQCHLLNPSSLVYGLRRKASCRHCCKFCQSLIKQAAVTVLGDNMRETWGKKTCFSARGSPWKINSLSAHKRARQTKVFFFCCLCRM
jgi:hypothetical protein